jgi:hypothetical protein
MQKLLASFLVVLFIVGCGYIPASQQARKVVGTRLFVEVTVSLEDPENAVLIKDATRKAVVTRFHSSLVPRAQALTELRVDLKTISFSALQFDRNGYVVVYRANVTLSVVRKSNGEEKTYRAVGTYDFTIEPNAIITDSQRFDAIRNGSLKALDSFIAQVGAEGSRL